MAACSDGKFDCALDAHCRVKPHMGIVGNAVRGALGAVSLEHLSSPAKAGVQPGQEKSGLRPPPEHSQHERGRQEPGTARQDRPGLRMGLLLGHRAGVRAQGPQRRHGPLHLGQEGRARVDARLAPEGLSRLAGDGGGQLGQARHPRDRLPGRILLRRAQGQAQARQPRRGRSRDPARLRKARHPDRGAEGARRRRGRAQGRGRRGVRQRLRRHHLPRGAEEGRGHLPLASPRRSASIPSW